MTQAMTTKAQASARQAPACAVSLFPLWCKEDKRRQVYQAKATISVQQDQDQQDGRTGVIMEPKLVVGELIHGHLWGWRTGPLSVRRGAEIARRADRGGAHERFTQLRSSPER